MISLIADAARAKRLKDPSRDRPSTDLPPRPICDQELILSGDFSPPAGFMTQVADESVRDSMKLKDGTIWPMRSGVAFTGGSGNESA